MTHSKNAPLIAAPSGLYGLTKNDAGHVLKYPIMWMRCAPHEHCEESVFPEYFDIEGDLCYSILHEASGAVVALGQGIYLTIEDWLNEQA